jgi:hypothetical protein
LELAGHKFSAEATASDKVVSFDNQSKTFTGPQKEETTAGITGVVGGTSTNGEFTVYSSQSTAAVPVGEVPVPVTFGVDVTVDARAVTEAFWKDDTPPPPPAPPAQTTCGSGSACQSHNW